MTKIPERIAFYGLLTIIFLSAIPYGTVDPFYKSLLIVSVCLFAAIRIIQGAVERSFCFSEPAMFLPLAGILLLAVIQTLPLPFSGEKTISSDPYETRIFIVTFAALLIAGEVLFYYTNSRQKLKALIALVLVTGAASVSFGILRDLVLNDPAGVIETYFAPETQSYAQFINRNHFVVLMEMALGLTLGLLLKGQLSDKFKFFGWILSALFIYAGIAANSRGGLISLAALSMFGAFVHIMTRQSSTKPRVTGQEVARGTGTFWRKAIIATAFCCLILGIFILIVAFVGGDGVVRRIETLPGEVQITDENKVNRLAIWRSTAELIKERPLLGVGFGGYASAITRYDESGGNFTLQQAHDEYLEILANGGIIAFILFAIFGVIVVRRSLHNFKSDDALGRSSCFGALIGIFGVMIHSFVDFGLHVMINALIFMVLIVISTVRLPRLAISGTN